MDPDGGNIWFYIVLLVVLILINAFFAMSEIAVISLNDAKIKRMAEAGNKKAKVLANMVGQPSRFLATIQVGVTLSGLLASAVAADTFAEYIVAAFEGTGINLGLVHGISLVVITIVLFFFYPHFRRTCSKAIGNEQCRKHFVCYCAAAACHLSV